MILKLKNLKTVKLSKVYSIGQRGLELTIVAIVAGTGQLTAQRMISPSCLPGSELREVQGECHVIIQPGEGLPRHHCHWSAPGYWHLVTPCHLSPDVCLAPGSGHLYVTLWARKCDMSYTQT